MKKKKLEVIYEDNHLIAINKKGGDLSQKDQTGDDSLIEKVKSYIKINYNKPGNVFLGSIHRLDRPTSGVIVFARTSKALERMHRLFKARETSKKYLVLVNKRPQNLEGILEDYLRKDKKKNKSFVCSKNDRDAKSAILTYRLLQEVGNHFLLEVSLFTGRHHQIRAQLANTDLKIVGDLKYGYHKANVDKSICLHCVSLGFVHPVTKKELHIVAPLPDIPEWSGVMQDY